MRSNLLTKTILSPLLNFDVHSENKAQMHMRMENLKQNDRIILSNELNILSKYLEFPNDIQPQDLKEKGVCLLLLDDVIPKVPSLWEKVKEFFACCFGTWISSDALMTQLSQVRGKLILQQKFQPLNYDLDLDKVIKKLNAEEVERLSVIDTLDKDIPIGIKKLEDLRKKFDSLLQETECKNFTSIISDLNELELFFKNEPAFSGKKVVLHNLKAMHNLLLIFENRSDFATAITNRSIKFEEIISNPEILVPYANVKVNRDEKKRQFLWIREMILPCAHKIIRNSQAELSRVSSESAKIRDDISNFGKRIQKHQKHVRAAVVKSCEIIIGIIYRIKEKADGPLVNLQKIVEAARYLVSNRHPIIPIEYKNQFVVCCDYLICAMNGEIRSALKDSLYVRIYKDKIDPEVYKRLKIFSYAFSTDEDKKIFLKDYLTYLQTIFETTKLKALRDFN